MALLARSCGRAVSFSTISSSSRFLRFRIPLVGAFCVLSLGFTNLGSASIYKTGCAQSHPLLPFLRSSIRGHSTGMDSNTSTVRSIVVYVTVPNKEAGKKLAESIVREKLAACVNRVPGIESVYFWDGKIQTDAEELLIIKTRESLLEALTEHVKANHEYEIFESKRCLRCLGHDLSKEKRFITFEKEKEKLCSVPEVISMPITGGNLKYLEWIKSSTRGD